MAFHIVLVEPEIPANTGNISRTCAATGTHLHLVEPLGFSLDDRYMKRAGLDYWPSVRLHVHESFDALKKEYPQGRFFCATTKAKRNYAEFNYLDEDFLVFGKETKGLPSEILEQHQETLIRMPMTDTVRSLNLSNSVAVVIYEALRQAGFPGLR
jgi:tRNA (cytidine/uridine-2'-O-)-methyltransferase